LPRTCTSAPHHPFHLWKAVVQCSGAHTCKLAQPNDEVRHLFVFADLNTVSVQSPALPLRRESHRMRLTARRLASSRCPRLRRLQRRSHPFASVFYLAGAMSRCHLDGLRHRLLRLHSMRSHCPVLLQLQQTQLCTFASSAACSSEMAGTTASPKDGSHHPVRFSTAILSKYCALSCPALRII